MADQIDRAAAACLGIAKEKLSRQEGLWLR
jgi:hypothetical protein